MAICRVGEKPAFSCCTPMNISVSPYAWGVSRISHFPLHQSSIWLQSNTTSIKPHRWSTRFHVALFRHQSSSDWPALNGRFSQLPLQGKFAYFFRTAHRNQGTALLIKVAAQEQWYGKDTLSTMWGRGVEPPPSLRAPASFLPHDLQISELCPVGPLWKFHYLFRVY